MKFGIGTSSRHRPMALMSTSFDTRLAERGGDLGRHHPAEGVADHRRRVEPEGVEQLVVVQDEVPQVVEGPDAVGVAERGAGVLGRVDGEALGQPVEERVPLEAGGAVEEHDRIARARRRGHAW